MSTPDRLFFDVPTTATTVTVNGVEITSKADWDRVLLRLEDLMRENERLLDKVKYASEMLLHGYGDYVMRVTAALRILEEHSSKDSEHG